MIDPTKLNNIYDQGMGPEDPVAPVEIKSFRKDVNPDPGEASPIQHATSVDPTKYHNIPGGVYDHQDVDSLRGQAQSAWDKWGNLIAGAVPKIATSFAEGLGYLGSLATEWGDDKDYSNSLTEAAKAGTQWADDTFPMYRKNNDMFGLTDAAWWTQNIQGLVVSASSFALEGAGFAKVLGSLGEGAEMLGAGRKVIGAANTIGEYATSGALAYTEGAMMGKNAYDKTYTTQLNNALRDGSTPEEAHEKASHIAAQSAATVVQLNTMINTGLNLESIAGLFAHKNEDMIRKFWTKTGRQAEGETFEAFADRVRNGTNIADKAIAKQVFHHEGLKHYAETALSEGIEEMTNQFAERTGLALGQEYDSKEKKGRTLGMFEQLGELQHYLDRTMDSEGALNFVMGAVGGVAQGALIDRIPLHKVEKMDSNGQVIYKQVTGEDGVQKPDKDKESNKIPETQRVTARNKGMFHDRQYFNNVRDAVVADLNTFDAMKKAMIDARALGHHEQADTIGEQMMEGLSFNAVHMGMASNYKETFREMAKTDNTIAERENLIPQIKQMEEQLAQLPDGPEKDALTAKHTAAVEQYKNTPEVTEAMRRGLAKNPQDNAYKKKAEDMAAQLDELEKIHEKVQAKYGSEDNPGIQRIADIISNRRMALHVQGKRISRLTQEIDSMQSEHDALQDAANEPDFNKSAIRYNQDIQTGVENAARYDAQVKILQRAKKSLEDPNDAANHQVAINAVHNLVRKYSIVGQKGDPTHEVLGKVVDTVVANQTRSKEQLKQMEDKLFQDSGYKTWVEKNPGKSFEDYRELVSKKHGITQEMLRKRAFRDSQKDEHEQGTRNLQEVESERGVTRMAARAEALYAELQKEEIEKEIANNIERGNRARQLLASDEALLRSNNLLQEQYRQELESLTQRHATLSQELVHVNEDLLKYPMENKVQVWTSDNQYQLWLEDIARQEDISESLEKVQRDLSHVQTLYNNISQEITEMEDELGVDKSKGKAEIPARTVEAKQAVPDNDTTPEQSKPVERAPEPAETAPAPEVSPEPTPVQQTVSSVSGALKRYVTELGMLQKPVQVQVQNIEQASKQSGHVSLDGLKDLVKAGLVEQADASSILQTLKEYVAALKALEQASEQEKELNGTLQGVLGEVAAERAPAAQDMPGEELDDEGMIDQPDSAVTQPPTNPERSINEQSIASASASHGGNKTVNVVKINALALKYVEFFNAKKNQYNIYSLVNQLNDKIHKDLLMPTGLPAGTGVKLAIDMDYKGKVSITDHLATDEYGHVVQQDEDVKNYLGADKKTVLPDGIDDVPIKIMSADGQTLGWLPRMKWVDAEYEGTGGDESKRNVVKTIELEDGTVIDNLKIQQDLLRAVRTSIVQAHNSGKGAVETSIESKGPGTLIYNREVNLNTETWRDYKPLSELTPGSAEYKAAEKYNKITSKLVWRPADKLCPDKSLKLAMVSANGIVQTGMGSGKVFDGPLANESERNSYRKMPVMLVPGANGQTFLAPLISRPLFDENGQQSDFNTIVRAIEVFIGSTSEDADVAALHKADADKVEKGTGFDIKTTFGLRSFINQYFTYTKGFNDSVIARTKMTSAKSEMSFQFKIEEALPGQTRGNVKIGTSFSGQEVMSAQFVDGKLDPKFVERLKRGLAGRYKNVTYEASENGGRNPRTTRGINEHNEDPFYSPMYKKDGTWAFTKHDSYNDYVKANTKTNVVGTNKLPGGEYVYAVHPQIQLNVDKMLTTPEVKASELTLPDPQAPPKATQMQQQLADDFESLMDLSPRQKPVRIIPNEVGQESEPGMIPVSINSLTEKLNFTHADHRNGKSVSEVLDEMQRLGIPYLAPGYNPFSKCL